jgi:hypothetical protein
LGSPEARKRGHTRLGQSNLPDRENSRSRESRTRSRHGKELWAFSCEVLTDVEDFMCCSYRNLESVIIIFIYDL